MADIPAKPYSPDEHKCRISPAMQDTIGGESSPSLPMPATVTTIRIEKSTNVESDQNCMLEHRRADGDRLMVVGFDDLL